MNDESKDIKEIADHLGITENAVKFSLKYGKIREEVNKLRSEKQNVSLNNTILMDIYRDCKNTKDSLSRIHMVLTEISVNCSKLEGRIFDLEQEIYSLND